MTAELFHGICLAAPISAEVLLAAIWQGLLLTLLTGVCLKFCPPIPAKVRFAIWAAVFLLLASFPAFPLWFTLRAAQVHLTHQAWGGAAAASSSPFHLGIAWAIALDAVWAAATLFALVALAHDFRQLRVLAKTSAVVSPELYGEELRGILAPVRGRSVQIRLSERVDAPSVIGFSRPAIVIPRWLWRELTPAELKQIVLHEVAHLRRGDDWSNLLQKLLRALCPLNPALVWVERRLCFEREAACDDAVLNASGNPRGYAACLTKLAEAALLRRSVSLAPGAWRRPSELARRVHRILGSRKRSGPLLSGGMIAATLAVFMGGALLLAQCPQIVSFDRRAEKTIPITAAHRAALPAVSRPPATKAEPVSFSSQSKAQHVRRAIFRRRAGARHALQAQLLRITSGTGDEGGSYRSESWIVFTVWSTQTLPPAVLPAGGNSAPKQYVTFSTSRWIIIQI